ncbi:MAG: hypothetical protein NZP34_03775, partial [Caldilineales bacterium]|nr:hypothetical protein [Caldilineales bacterium]
TPTPGPGSIWLFVFHDENGNGRFDAAETPWAGLFVTLEDAQGQALSTVPSNDEGFAIFAALAPGRYRLTVPIPPEHSPTTPYPVEVEVVADTRTEAVLGLAPPQHRHYLPLLRVP